MSQGGIKTITSGGTGTSTINFPMTFPTINGQVFTNLYTSAPNSTHSGCYNVFRASFIASYYNAASNGTLYWIAYGW